MEKLWFKNFFSVNFFLYLRETFFNIRNYVLKSNYLIRIFFEIINYFGQNLQFEDKILSTRGLKTHKINWDII